MSTRSLPPTDPSAANAPGPADVAVEAPLTLDQPAAQVHGFFDQFGLWANLGISLLIPVVAGFFLPTSMAATVAAIVVGSVLGCGLLGAVAAIGARLAVPTMVVFRGLFGRAGSSVPTVLNIAQCLGWATFEVWIISVAAGQIFPAVPRSIFVVAAGVIATVMALRPLRSSKWLKRIAVVAVLACSAYFLVDAARRPLTVAGDGWTGWWTNVDLVVAMSVSWIPLVADYSRHGRSPRTSGFAVGLGFGLASAAFFFVGVLGIAAYQPADGDVVGALLAVPAGAIALAILALDEVDQAFANVYSTAISVQNLAPRTDRRVLAVVVGVLAVVLGLVITDGYAYEGFLLLIGAVFTPLGAVLVVDFFVVRRGRYDVGPDAPGRWLLLVPWLVGFVAFQLTSPTFVSNFPQWQDFWRSAQSALGIPADNGWSAAVVALVVAGVLTGALGPFAGRTHRAVLAADGERNG